VESSNELASMTKRAASAEFYVESPFRNSRFVIVTCVFVLDLCLCALVLLGCWRQSNLQVAFMIALVILFLVAMWRLGFRTHEDIRILFEAGQIEELEKGSAFDKVLGGTTNILLGGLFTGFVLAALCLGALGNVILSR